MQATASINKKQLAYHRKQKSSITSSQSSQLKISLSSQIAPIILNSPDNQSHVKLLKTPIVQASNRLSSEINQGKKIYAAGTAAVSSKQLIGFDNNSTSPSSRQMSSSNLMTNQKKSNPNYNLILQSISKANNNLNNNEIKLKNSPTKQANKIPTSLEQNHLKLLSKHSNGIYSPTQNLARQSSNNFSQQIQKMNQQKQQTKNNQSKQDTTLFSPKNINLSSNNKKQIQTASTSSFYNYSPHLSTQQIFSKNPALNSQIIKSHQTLQKQLRNSQVGNKNINKSTISDIGTKIMIQNRYQQEQQQQSINEPKYIMITQKNTCDQNTKQSFIKQQINNKQIEDSNNKNMKNFFKVEQDHKKEEEAMTFINFVIKQQFQECNMRENSRKLALYMRTKLYNNIPMHIKQEQLSYKLEENDMQNCHLLPQTSLNTASKLFRETPMQGDGNVFTIETVQTLNEGDVEDEGQFGIYQNNKPQSIKENTPCKNSVQQIHQDIKRITKEQFIISRDQNQKVFDMHARKNAEDFMIKQFFQDHKDERVDILNDADVKDVIKFRDKEQNIQLLRNNFKVSHSKILQIDTSEDYEAKELQPNKSIVHLEHKSLIDDQVQIKNSKCHIQSKIQHNLIQQVAFPNNSDSFSNKMIVKTRNWQEGKQQLQLSGNITNKTASNIDKIDIKGLKRKVQQNLNMQRMSIGNKQSNNNPSNNPLTPKVNNLISNKPQNQSLQFDQDHQKAGEPKTLNYRRNIFEKASTQQVKTQHSFDQVCQEKEDIVQILNRNDLINQSSTSSLLSTPEIVMVEQKDIILHKDLAQTFQMNYTDHVLKGRNQENYQNKSLINEEILGLENKIFSRTVIEQNSHSDQKNRIFLNYIDNLSMNARVTPSQIDLHKLGQKDGDCSISSNKSLSSIDFNLFNDVQVNEDTDNHLKTTQKINLCDDKNEFIITKTPLKKLARLRTPTTYDSKKLKQIIRFPEEDLKEKYHHSVIQTENIILEDFEQYETDRQIPQIFQKEVKSDFSQESMADKINELNLNSEQRKKKSLNFSRKIYNNHILDQKPASNKKEQRNSYQEIETEQSDGNANDELKVEYKDKDGKIRVCWFKLEKRYLKLALNTEMTNLIFSIDSGRNRINVVKFGISSLIITINGTEKYQIKNDQNPQIIDTIQSQIKQRLRQNKLDIIKKKTIDSKIGHIKQVSIQGFQQLADTGDIIFFKGKTMGSKFQRFFTRCDFDHVALILKYRNDKLVLFESTGTSGVDLLTWDTFLQKGFQNLYDEIAFRHLHFQRTTEKMKKLEQFIKDNNGKKYRLNAIDLIKSKTPKKSNEQEGYFCSELVAASYQVLDILPQEKSASSYWPSTLADSNLKLNIDAQLSHLIYIQYDKDLQKKSK